MVTHRSTVLAPVALGSLYLLAACGSGVGNASPRISSIPEQSIGGGTMLHFVARGAQIRRQKRVLGAERVGMDDQPGLVCRRHEARRHRLTVDAVRVDQLTQPRTDAVDGRRQLAQPLRRL